MVSWHCGDSNERIAAGADDFLIVKLAQQLKDYGRPIFLRWFWEPNLPLYPTCLGPLPAADQASRYVAAYRHVADLFDKVGASNVAFVWSVSTVTNAEVMQTYYPGDKYVDWIGADGYDREKLGRDAFTHQFEPWYSRFEPRGKPMVITETGATTDQVEFLQGVATVLPKDFPKIKGFIYFDSVGQTDWRLSSYGGAGIAAYAELGRNPYFAAMPKP
jgi:beta-mannanase